MSKKRNSKSGMDPYLDREKSKYNAPLPSREYILNKMEGIKKPLSVSKIAQMINVTDPYQIEGLVKRLGAMIRDEQITKNKRGLFVLANRMALVQGALMQTKDSGGYIVDETVKDQKVFLSHYQTRDLLPGDRIIVRPTKKNDQNELQGVVVDIIERATDMVYGIYGMLDGEGAIKPLQNYIKHEVLADSDSEIECRSGDIVAAQILQYPHRHQPMIAKVVENLGTQETPGIESIVAQRIHKLPMRFSDEVMQEVDSISDEIKLDNRKDWRGFPFVTIDGPSSKDFDDAVFATEGSDGMTELYVAIADVSHYVKVGGAIDKEAFDRATSVYFPDRVIPMLPEKLSNDLCSLKPDCDRYAVGVKMHINQEGKIHSWELNRVVICSKARLTYSKVNEMINKNMQIPDWFASSLAHLTHLTKILLSARRERGAIEFNQNEVVMKLGSDKKIKKIQESKRLFSHCLIEEAMLACNESMANMLLKSRTSGVYRNHLPPDEQKLDQLSELVSNLGIDVSQGIERTISSLPELKEEVRAILETALIRSLKQARYEDSSRGHYGLSLKHYTHFTSPIRRYPDLMVHRLLLTDEKLDSLGHITNHCSERERRAEEAVRDAVAWLKADHMSKHIGKTFSGVVSSVASFGVFVNISAMGVDGLVHVTELPNDYYRYDSTLLTLTGERNSQVFTLGDLLCVQCQKVSIWDKKIDFVIMEK